MVPKNARSSHWHFSLPNPGSSDWQWIFHMVEAWHVYQTPLHNLPGNYLKQVNLLKFFRAGWVLGVIWSQIVLPKTIRLEPKLSRKLTAKAPEDPQIWKSGTSSSNQISILVGVPNLSFSGGWKMISKLGESPIFKGWKKFRFQLLREIHSIPWWYCVQVGGFWDKVLNDVLYSSEN